MYSLNRGLCASIGYNNSVQFSLKEAKKAYLLLLFVDKAAGSGAVLIMAIEVVVVDKEVAMTDLKVVLCVVTTLVVALLVTVFLVHV